MRKFFTIVLLTFQFCAVAQNWQSMGTKKFNHAVEDIYSDTATGDLFATGFYWMIDTSTVFGLSQWNGSEWELPFTDCGAGSAKQIIKFQGIYYVNKNPYLLKWNGTSWDTTATTDGGFFDLYNDGDSVLYAVGTFGILNSMAVSNIARFDGVTWSGFGSTIWAGGGASCAFRYQGQMYFGGTFYDAANGIWRITKWDGTNWNAVGGGITWSLGAAFCMEEYNGELYVGGYMIAAAGNPGNYIARWNGTSWSQVGGGIWNGQVFNLKAFNGNLWAVGQFDEAGGIPASYVARYDGLDWCAVGVFDNVIGAIEVHNNELYIGGNFWTVDGDSVNKVVRWIGGNFSDTCGHLNTGLTEILPQMVVQAFPNPASTHVTFQISGEPTTRTVILVDNLGREIWRKETNESTVEYFIDGAAAGLYHYRIEDQGAVKFTGKLIIE